MYVVVAVMARALLRYTLNRSKCGDGDGWAELPHSCLGGGSRVRWIEINGGKPTEENIMGRGSRFNL